MNKTFLELAGINCKTGIERFAGKEALYEKYLRKFLDETTFADLKQGMEQGEYHQAFFAAHTLKGVAGNLSLDGLLKKVGPMVEQLRDEADIAGAVAAFPAVEEEYRNTIAALREGLL